MNDNRQKLMLGVLAVVALGAGGYWFVFRESSATVQSQEAATVAPKQRERAQTADSGTKKRDTSAARSRPAEIEVKERERPDDQTLPAAKTRARAGDKVEKKKEIKPAA